MITFTIPGTPVGKPRQTQRDKWAERDCVLRYRAWADRARRICQPLPPVAAITDVSWTA